MRHFDACFRPSALDRVVDIGGYSGTWAMTRAQPAVVLANLDAAPWDTFTALRFAKVQADGRLLPFADRKFDIAFSNSVIEHVGSWQDQQSFADEVRRVAPRYYVQTPHHHFLVEPHLIGPPIHLLPSWLARPLVRWCSLWGWLERPSREAVDTKLAETRLLTRAEMAALFPEAQIVIERFLGMPKSIIAQQPHALA
jgi:hypothetical protein